MGESRVLAQDQLSRPSLNSAARIGRSTALLAFLSLLVAACSATSGTARGLVVAVDGSLTVVEAFTVLVEGEEMIFLPMEDGDYAFPLPHLREHQRAGEPVFVGWESRNDLVYALSLEDG